MELFELNGKVVVDLADAVKAFDTIQAEGQKTQGKMSKFFTGLGKGALAVGKTVAVGLGASATAIGGLVAKATSLAGELEQNMGGSEQVFKEFAGKMQETAKSAFENMGLSTAEFLGTANKMGALFQGAGFSIEESSGLASDAMQRAADVASIMGIDTASAMEAIAGAAKGNFTMMDNLGVAMNDTTLQAYALEKGISKSTTEMTNQEKIGLAMEMFMEKTAYAAGNYAKENETLAGSLGTAKAALTNFLDGSGDVDSLVGAFTNAANVIVKNVSEIAPRLISGLIEVVNQLVPMIPPLLGELLPVVIQGASDLINGVVAVLPQLLDLITTVLIPQLLTALVSVINALISALPTLIQQIASALPSLLLQLVNAAVELVVLLCQMLPQIIQPLVDNLPMIVMAIVEGLLSNLPILVEGLIQLILAVALMLPDLMLAILDMIPQIFVMICDALGKSLPILYEGLLQMAKKLIPKMISYYKDLPKKFLEIFKSIFNGITKIFAPIGEWFRDKFGKAKDEAVEPFNKIGVWFGEKFAEVKEKIMKPFNEARDKIKEIADKIKGFFKGDIEMPKIKKPSFSIDPKGWKIGDLLDGVIPKLSIKWNAKGAIMKQPTLFGYNPSTGSLQGGGEAGDEAIAPIDTLQGYVASAVASQNAVLVDILNKILGAIVHMDDNMGGNLRDALEGLSFGVGKREFGRLVREVV